MHEAVDLFVAMKPAAKARPRVTRRGVYMPKAYQVWRKTFQELARPQYQGEPFTCPVYLAVIFSTKTGTMRPDIDNAAGAVLDALQPWFIKNDSQVRELIAGVVIDGKFPGLCRPSGIAVLLQTASVLEELAH